MEYYNVALTEKHNPMKMIHHFQLYSIDDGDETSLHDSYIYCDCSKFSVLWTTCLINA